MGLRKLFSILTLNDRGLSYAIDKKRRKLSRQLSLQLSHTVKYGPFKGMKLSAEHWWGSADRAAMLLGIYEQEILQQLTNISPIRDVFIDLGAADGYYSIGALISGQFKTSYAFEISDKGRKTITSNADLNACTKGLRLYGQADSNFTQNIDSVDLQRAVLLVDIEGAEFDLLTEQTLEKLKNTVVFVELHDWFFTDGDLKLRRLMQDASIYFKTSTFTTGSRDLSVFPELVTLDDSERWLIASEGRNRLMTWLRLDPLYP